MEPCISIVTLGVTDLPRSVQFYRDGLGLNLSDEDTESIAFFQTSGTWLALYPRDALAADVGISTEGSGFSGVTLAHNVHTRKEVDELLHVAVEAAAQPWSSLPRTPSGEGTPGTSLTRTVTYGRWHGIPTLGLSDGHRGYPPIQPGKRQR